MVCNMQESDGYFEEPILEKLETLSACQYLLNSAQENVELGRTKWLTNSITGETLYFTDVEPLSRSVASAMYKRGMRKGDVVLYMTSDVTRIYAFTVGVWRCAVPTRKILQIPPFQNSRRSRSMDRLRPDLHCPEDVLSEADLDDPLLILCTSGTTGKSKGAVYTNLQVLAFTIGTSNIPFNEAPALLVLRCTHVLGLLFPIRNLKAGVWSVLMHEVEKTHIFKAVDKYKPQLAFGFATFLALLATDPEAQKYDRSSLEVIITGGMVLTEKFYKEMMTLPGCGKLYPNTRLKVLDLETGRALGPGQQGEIAICSPIQCSGYWKGTKENNEQFQDGWMRTGDLGYYDSQGFVYVVDRIKETFKYFNCHEAVVVGVHDPNGGDRIPRAFVVLKHGIDSDDFEALQDEIRMFVDSKVASYKRLRGGLYIVPALPKNKTGKVSRAEIVSLAVAAAAC
ncbi:4-coumarate--CoA ligase-like 9 [Orchesella cincta]|uniref:4-coumarate--CoA ligase-like 9 n=1 Tax=Orchesella cincta TaxID=48709 RepID=A0A1D2MBK8_ORCCI|nr:4-coumarate--CoA ligase-like 9 [Orchesella cincta]